LGNTVGQPRWGVIDLIIVYFLTVFLTMLFSIVAGQFIGDSMTYFITCTLIQVLVSIGLVFLFVLYINKAELSDLGLTRASRNDLLQYGLIGGTLLMIAMVLIGIPISTLQPDIQPQLYEQMLRSIGGYPEFLILFFLGAVAAPVSEELFYRGMLYPVFRRYLGPGWGAVIAGLLFGLAHWDLWRTIPLAIGGAVLCYMYEKTGSILVTMLAHGTWNGLLSLLVYYSLVNI